METQIDLVYLQKENGEFINTSAYTAWEGCKLLGVPTQFFDNQALIRGYLPLQKNTLVCGYVGAIKRALETLQVPWPEVPDYPEELQPFWGRKIWSSTLGNVRRNEPYAVSITENKSNQPYAFIKPKGGTKLFTGHIRTGHLNNMIQTALCDDELEIYVSEPVKFVSEYRVFVHQGLMVGCQFYLGDFTLFPDFEVITAAIAAFTSAPVAYAADFGVTLDGRTLLVEINDCFSLGYYGLSSLVYMQMLQDRWLEIVNQEK